MPSPERQKAKAGRSREMDILPDYGKTDIKLEEISNNLDTAKKGIKTQSLYKTGKTHLNKMRS